MNKLIDISIYIIIVLAALAFTGAATAATVDTNPPGSGGSSGGGSSEDIEDQVTRDNLDLVMTVIKNEKPEVTGNLFGNPAFVILSLKLQDSPVGNYGYLDISADGDFRYAIKNDSPQIQALGLNDLATETFRYQYTTADNVTFDATLTIYILGNPSVSYDNVEIEFNNTTTSASPLHAGSSSDLGQYMRGQLITSSDRDWFEFNSLGNEIVSLELCPEGSQCFDEKNWVMYVFDAEKFNKQHIESKTYQLRRYVRETGEILETDNADHMYLLLNKGIFDNSLVGVIDPCFGDRRTLDIGVGAGGKTFYVAITSPLVRKDSGGPCGSGDVIREEEIKVLAGDIRVTIIQEYLTAYYSDDQYSFRITRTGADPFAVIQPLNSTFDSTGRVANVPQMRINNQLYSLNFKQLSAVSNNDPMTFGIQSYELLDAPLVSNSYLPTFNPANNIVRIPQLVLDTGAAYTVELLYQPLSNTLQLLRADPLN